MPDEFSQRDEPISAPPDADVRWRLLVELIRRGDSQAVARMLSQAKDRPGADWLAYWSRMSLPDHPETSHVLADYAIEVDIAYAGSHLAKAHSYAASGEHSAASEHYDLAKAIDPDSWDPTFENPDGLSADPEAVVPEAEPEIQIEYRCSTVEDQVEEDCSGDEFEAAEEEAEPEYLEEAPESHLVDQEPGGLESRSDSDASVEDIYVDHDPEPLDPVDLTPKWHLNSALQIHPLPPLIAPESIPKQHLPAFQRSSTEPCPLKVPGQDSPASHSHRTLAIPRVERESHPTLPGEDEVELFPGDYHPDEVVLLVADSGVIPKLPEKNDTKERVSATLTTVLVHIAFFVVLALILISIPNKKPPEIIATTASQTKTDSVKRKISRSVRSNPSPPSQSNLAVIAASATSQVVAPTIEFEKVYDNLNLGSSFGAGNAFGGGTGSGGTFGVPAAMKSRCSAQERAKMLSKHGGSRGSEIAIVRALNWIARQQNKDGSWGQKYKCAMTGLALLAFLGHCETPDSERYGNRVMKGIFYLVEVSKKKRIYATAGGHSAAYEHGIATYALGESYAIARLGKRPLPGMRDAFVKGTATIINGQNPDGGWSYGYPKSGSSDISVTGWQYQALKAAKHTKIKIEGLDRAIEKAQTFLARIQDRNTGGFPYRPGQPGKRTLSAAGVLGLQMLGGEEKYADNIERGLRFALGDLHEQSWRNANIYTWYYNTQACFQFGGNPWDHWNKMFSNSLTLNQAFDGAWDGAAGAQAGPDAHLYTTCLSVLMLEVYYRYLPTSG